MAYDCIIIGAGHNGLVCANYLARSGRKVLVLEAADRVGGAAITRDFAPGFRVSACAHLLHQMPQAMIKELDLARHGLSFAATALPTHALALDGRPLRLDARAIGLRSGADGAAFGPFTERLGKFAAALLPALQMVPPRLANGDWSDKLGLVKLGWQIRSLGRTDMRELLRILGMNAYDLLEEQFESDLVKGALGFDAVLGSGFGPRSPGSVLTLLYRLAAQTASGREPLSQPQGGMGAVTDALAAAARAAGVEIRTGAAVARIAVENDKTSGVVLADGAVIAAGTVISNADPRTTFLKLLGTEHLDTGFVRRIDHLRSRGLVAKLHLALDGPPEFTGLDRVGLGGRLLVAPSLDYLERAFNPTKYGEMSEAPALEITVPTVNDPSLAPAGQHVLSALVQYAPYKFAAGWDVGKPRLTDRAIEAIEAYAPGLRRKIIAVETLTPLDIEAEFGMTGGHWHHGELAFDQFFMVRPVPGAAQYRTPVAGLFLCGAGSHPGGGVMGAAGRNAARQILKQAA
jgi:phytoene dehydrogenase-like protein